MKSIRDFNVQNKRVLVRCDFNVPLSKEGFVQDDFRIKQALATINYLIENKAKIILMSHLGRPKGEIKEELSLLPVRKKLEEYLNRPVIMAVDCVGRKVEKKALKIKEGEILLLENLRFYKQEEENDFQFSEELAKLAEIYINDAFSVSHREHASVIGVSRHLPSGAGILLEREIEALSKILKNPKRPLTTIIGGAKISDKIKVIEKFLEKADNVIIGGKIANTILMSESGAGEPMAINLESEKLYLPSDALLSPDETGKNGIRESLFSEKEKDEMILDIGSKTVNDFSEVIKKSKTIFWSGPMGFFENSLFEKGTKKIAESIISNKDAYKIAGGGDTIFALAKFGLRDKFDHVSTGGGAMLEFLSGRDLPGLKTLINPNQA